MRAWLPLPPVDSKPHLRCPRPGVVQPANEALGLEVDQSNLRHDKLLTEVRHLYKSTTAASSLVQDPALGTYYMVVLASERLPQLRDLLAQVRDRAATIADFGLFQAQGYSALRFRLDLINATLQELEADLTLLYEMAPPIAASWASRPTPCCCKPIRGSTPWKTR